MAAKHTVLQVDYPLQHLTALMLGIQRQIMLNITLEKAHLCLVMENIVNGAPLQM